MESEGMPETWLTVTNWTTNFHFFLFFNQSKKNNNLFSTEMEKLKILNISHLYWFWKIFLKNIVQIDFFCIFATPKNSWCCSSVGRATDWKSVCHWFNSRQHHLFNVSDYLARFFLPIWMVFPHLSCCKLTWRVRRNLLQRYFALLQKKSCNCLYFGNFV